MIVRRGKPDNTRKSLREAIEERGLVRLIEAHDPLSALVGERVAAVQDDHTVVEFDGFWSSSLTDAARRGLPDIELLSMRSRLEVVNEIFGVTTKALLMDGDTGGWPEHFEYTVRDLERAGVSGVVIEDKTGLKRNSLLGTKVPQMLADPVEFAEKIARGRAVRSGDDFMIVARIESLILEAGQKDAARRADLYVEAGTDAVMIHSRQDEPAEVLEFAAAFRRRHPNVPLVSVPTTYNGIRATDLRAAGFNVVIFANHLLRSSLKAMDTTARQILLHDRSLEAEASCAELDEVLSPRGTRVANA